MQREPVRTLADIGHLAGAYPPALGAHLTRVAEHLPPAHWGALCALVEGVEAFIRSACPPPVRNDADTPEVAFPENAAEIRVLEAALPPELRDRFAHLLGNIGDEAFAHGLDEVEAEYRAAVLHFGGLAPALEGVVDHVRAYGGQDCGHGVRQDRPIRRPGSP